MELSKIGERRIVEAIRDMVRHDPNLIADFDEDAAVLDLKAGKYAVTTDMGHIGTHFMTDDPVSIGRKIVTSNATDLLATGAVPAYMLISVSFPAKYSLGFVRRLYRSMDRQLQGYGAYLIGGDTNKGRDFSYSVTMIGKVIKPLLRNGARVGDYVVLTGQIGNAAAGYVALRRRLKAERAFVRAQLDPSIDIGLCRQLIPHAHSGIDISDGLAYELNEISRLSRKRIIIEWDELPIHKHLPDFCRRNRLRLPDIVMNHGEDYQIVYTTPDPTLGIIIGRVLIGEGVHMVKDGKKETVEPKGYEHFKSN